MPLLSSSLIMPTAKCVLPTPHVLPITSRPVGSLGSYSSTYFTAAIRASAKDRSAPGKSVVKLTSSQCSYRSEEHTSELQSRLHLVCRLLLEKKKNQHIFIVPHTTHLISVW